jgi:hypothetical protein
MLHHSHYCQHCDRTLTCPIETARCLLGGYDISKLHQCEQAERYRKAMRNAMRDNASGCKYGCFKLPCTHGATFRFPGIGEKPSRAIETFEKNPPSAIGDAIKLHGLYSKPDARRLRDFIDGRTIASGYGIRRNSANDASDGANDRNHAPSGERSLTANLERTSGNPATVASGDSANAPTVATHDETKCVNRKCEYCNARYRGLIE